MYCAIDIETTGLDWQDKIVSVGISWEDSDRLQSRAWNTLHGDLFHQPVPIPLVRSELRRIVQDSDIIFMHNTCFDLSYLLRDGILDKGDVNGKIIDTLLTARMTGPHLSYTLDNLCNYYNIVDPEWLQTKKTIRKNIIKVPIQQLLEYNSKDCAQTLKLGKILLEKGSTMYSREKLLLESDFARLMGEVRLRGKAIDLDKLDRLVESYKVRKRDLYLKYLYPLKIDGANDRTRIIRWLSGKGYHLTKTEKGNDSINEVSLIALKDQVDPETAHTLDIILECRGLEKAISTWLEPMYDFASLDGRIHPNYTVGGATTYRLTCSHPGFQAMPKLDIWKPFISGDYSQAELRLGAAIAVENHLAEMFANGEDAHLGTARLMFGPEKAKERRKDAKQCNFAVLYGSGAPGLSQAAGVSITQAQKLLDHHRKTFPAFPKATKAAERIWTERKYMNLVTGVRLWANSEDLLRPYKAFNNWVQGGIAQVVKLAMLELDRQGIPIIGQIHDSIECEYGSDLELIKRVMQGVDLEGILTRTDPPIVMVADVDEVLGYDWRVGDSRVKAESNEKALREFLTSCKKEGQPTPAQISVQGWLTGCFPMTANINPDFSYDLVTT